MYLPLIWVYHAQSLAKYTCSQGHSVARQGGSSGLAGDQFSLAVSLNAGITTATAAAAAASAIGCWVTRWNTPRERESVASPYVTSQSRPTR